MPAAKNTHSLPFTTWGSGAHRQPDIYPSGFAVKITRSSASASPLMVSLPRIFRVVWPFPSSVAI